MPKTYPLKAELHCHSNQGFHVWYIPFLYDSIQTVEDIVSRCVQQDIRILAITDHDCLTGSLQAQALVTRHKLPLLVIPSSEISSRDGHILAYGITREIPPRLSAQETIQEIHRQGGLAVAAHPYMLTAVGDLINTLEFDAIERFNAMIPAYFNRLAANSPCPLPGTAGSDAHQPEEIGRSLTLFPQSVNSLSTFQSALKSGFFHTQTSSTPVLPMVSRHLVGNLRLHFNRVSPTPG